MSEWISVEERLPEMGDEVQVFCIDSMEQMVAFYRHDGTFQFACYTDEHGQKVAIVCEPTHWAELREPPQQ